MNSTVITHFLKKQPEEAVGMLVFSKVLEEY